MSSLPVFVGPGLAQKVDVRTIESTEGGLVLEFSVEWPTSMKALADSVSIERGSLGNTHALSFGMPVLSETIELPSLAMPRVSLVAGDYETLHLPVGDTTGLAPLRGPVVWAEGLGTSRRQALVTLGVRLLLYEGNAVRRYRRVRAAVRYGSGATTAAAKQSLRTQCDVSGPNPHLAVTESVLAGGIVYKIPIEETGLYRIDRDFIASLPDLGLDPSAIDPDHVRIYGNGGAPVPALNSLPRVADLAENPAIRLGGGDGRFDAGDAVLFYGKGPTGWTYENGAWEHYVHPFSNVNYYFIKIGDDEEGIDLPEEAYPAFGDAEVLREVEARYVEDFDELMWSPENQGSGHTWVGTILRTGDVRTLLDDVVLPGRAQGVVRYQIRTAIHSNPPAQVLFESNGASRGSLRAARALSSGPTAPVAVAGIAMIEHEEDVGSPLQLSMRFDPAAVNDPRAAVDWVRVFYPRLLRAVGDSLHFVTPGGRTGRFEFVLEAFSGEPYVWDVTQPGDFRRLGVRTSGGAYHVQVEVPDCSPPRELVAFRASAARPLASVQAQRVAAQNLHASALHPDLVILVPNAFRTAAEALAEHRRRDGLDVLVTDVDRIYNEFSGGLVDVRGLRDYLRFLYDRGEEVAKPLRYALLFGDGHFNYRGRGEPAELTNWIPPYETEGSFDPERSYASDDYYGLLDADEGVWAWPGTSGSDTRERVDVGIGRLPVQTPEEAAAMVAKIQHYEDASTYGPWRTRYLFVADDHYNGVRPRVESLGDLHTQNADVVAQLLEGNYPWIDLQKIYGISYTREFLNGWRLPGVERDLQAALADGVLVMNYSGHGGESGLAQENIFTKEDAAALRNYDRLPLFVTATCSFGWWDLSDEQSAAEVLLLNASGGAIALMTTVRLVYTSANVNTLNVGLNRALNQEMFELAEDGRPRRLGDILVDTKNTVVGLQGNNRKFNLLGDPALRLGHPEREVVVESVNGTPLGDGVALRALEEVTIEGVVQTVSKATDTAFDGQVSLTIFDAKRRVSLAIPRQVMPRNYYTVREDLIWRGVAPVAAGRFAASFVVPKDISYSNEPGRVSAYARSATHHAGGYTEGFVVGGTASEGLDDDVGPEISLYLNDSTFVSGGLTPPDPRLIVHLRDESGINTVGAGVGHEVLLVVDGNERQAVDVSGRFESTPGSFRSGRVSYPFEEYPENLEDGPHSLTVRAWDVVNNSNTAVLDFVISSARDVVLRHVYNYPNPTSGRTRFVFEHNQPTGTVADVQVRIYTLAGRPVRTIEGVEALPAGTLPAGPVQVPWDGLDEDMNPLASGMYLYKVRVATEGIDGERYVSEHIERLAIIR